MSDVFSFRLLATDGVARRGEIATPHGAVATPAFLPIGTQATVKGLAPEAVRATGADIVLANTYHLMLRPGAERIASLGGLHRFMNWPWAILTDSGGFQVMSLSQLRKVEDKGVTFRSHLDGAMVELSPERAIEVQHLLGSDIAMQLDECLQLPASQGELHRAMQLSLAWAERSKRAFERTSSTAAARDFSRAYLHHLVKANEMLGAILLTTVNLAYYQALMADMRAAIAAGTFADFRAAARESWARGDVSCS